MRQKINWGMLVSHHPPCQYNRTYTIGKVRLCTRCTAVVAGILFYLFQNIIEPAQLWVYMLILVLPLPAIFNFTLNELGRIKNTNPQRVATGFLLGVAIGMIISEFTCNHIFTGISGTVWILLLEMLVAVILMKKGVLDNFIAQYAEGAFKK